MSISVVSFPRRRILHFPGPGGNVFMSLFVCATHVSVELRPFYASSDHIYRPTFTLLSMAVFGLSNHGYGTTRKVLSPWSPQTSSLSPFHVGVASAGTRGKETIEYGSTIPLLEERGTLRAQPSWLAPGTIPGSCARFPGLASLEDQDRDIMDDRLGQ
jgi:hypothetical protein